MDPQKVLALDISSSAGFAYFHGELREYGLTALPNIIHSYGQYPWSFHHAAKDMAARLYERVVHFNPDVVVIEETNLARARYSQKFLEFTHAYLLELLKVKGVTVIYVSSSSWRSTLGLVMSKEDKRNNAKLSRAEKKAREAGTKVDKKSLGIRGKVGKKHLAIRYVNDTYGLNLKVKDNDIADAICLGTAYILDAPHCDGII